MGVDIGKALHVVILRSHPDLDGPDTVVHLAVCHDFSELDGPMDRFKVQGCVIDGLPETHSTREFAMRHVIGKRCAESRGIATAARGSASRRRLPTQQSAQ